MRELGESRVDIGEQGNGSLVLGVEAALARIEAGDLGLESGEVVLRACGALECFLARVRQPLDLIGGRGSAGLRGVDLAGQPGEPLASIGGRPGDAGDPAVFGLVLGLGVVALGRARGRGRPGNSATSSPHRLLAPSDLGGLRLELVGIRAGPRCSSGSSAALRSRSAARLAVPRRRSRNPDSANQVS